MHKIGIQRSSDLDFLIKLMFTYEVDIVYIDTTEHNGKMVLGDFAADESLLLEEALQIIGKDAQIILRVHGPYIENICDALDINSDILVCHNDPTVLTDILIYRPSTYIGLCDNNGRLDIEKVESLLSFVIMDHTMTDMQRIEDFKRERPHIPIFVYHEQHCSETAKEYETLGVSYISTKFS
jgi:hypothetical protein